MKKRREILLIILTILTPYIKFGCQSFFLSLGGQYHSGLRGQFTRIIQFDEFLDFLTRIGLLELENGWYSCDDITEAINKAQAKAEANKQRRKG